MSMSSYSFRTAIAGVALVVASLVAGPAAASWLQPHTHQEALSVAEVERGLMTGKSWFVLDLDFRFKQSTSHFIGDTAANVGFTEGTHWERENNDGRWTYRRWELGINWGFARNIDLFVRVPVVWGSVYNSRMVDAEGNADPITSAGLGDLIGGARFQFLRMQNPENRTGNSLIATLKFRFPTGAESPGSYIGGPNNVATIITGTGTWGIDLEARYKQQLAIVAIEAGVGYTWNPTGTVMYLIENVENQFNQHLDPGDVIHGDVGVTVQFFRNLALRGDLFLDYRTKSRWGSTSNTFPACKECAPIEGSDGLYMDVQARLISDFNIHLGLDAYFRYTIAGRHNFLWPLEDISPSRGWTLGANLAYRF
jgi:hypothetical protein